jgi:negative regulator of sigma-B (phosphoserine phosphatase)
VVKQERMTDLRTKQASQTPGAQPLIDWGVATRSLPGQAVSGDLHLVKSSNHGLLLAAVDGIGHGPEATAAAARAVSILERHADESLVSLLSRCHAGLKPTRGVVMTVASLDPANGALSWLGVGNVEARLVRPDAPAARLVLRNGLVGLVGFKLPDSPADVIPIAPQDVLVFATDGIGPGFATGWDRTAAPQQIADRIMEKHFKGTDDALVLVARYVGIDHE